MTWLDPVIGSVAAGKALAVVAMAVGFVGATRLARSVPLPWRWASGAIYALGPFVATRLAVGHLFVLAAMAALPFAAPTLLRPDRDRRRTFVWAAVLALTGFLGGLFALVLVVVGAIGVGRRSVSTIAVAVAAQAPWLVPGVLVFAGGSRLASAGGFRPVAAGPSGLLALAGGQGFWQSTYQVGWHNALVDGVLGGLVVALAWAGRREIGARLPRVGVVATGAIAFIAATSIPLLDPVTDLVYAVPGAASVREAQRLLPLFLLWAAPAATMGANRLADRRPAPAPDGHEGWVATAARPSALVLGILLVTPGLWGAGGQLEPAPLPDGWVTVRDRILAEPGTVLALPWFQYLDLDVAGGRRVLHPLPLWLGGDVISASDPRIPGVEARERSDPREAAAAALVADNLGGELVSSGLVDLGVRWVAVLDGGGVVRGRSYGDLHVEALAEDPGLRHVFSSPSIDLFEVVSWEGSVTVDGKAVGFRPIIGPFAHLDASGPATYARAGTTGWMRGVGAASVDPSGQVAFPAGSGIVWYWPAVLTLVSYFGFVAAFVSCHWSNYRN